MNININRLNISVHGLSAQLIEEAVHGLDKELGKRVCLQGFGQPLLTGSVNIQTDQISLDAVHIDSAIDSATLRGLIAERLLEALDAQQSEYSSTGVDV